MQNSSQASLNITTILLEMGYSKEMISLALKEAKDTTIEHLLDLLASREKHYSSILKNSGPLKPLPIVSNQDNLNNKQEDVKETEGKLINSLNEEINQQNNKPLQKNDNQPQKVEKKPNGNGENNIKDNKNENNPPVRLDRETSEYVDAILQAFKRLKSKDPNWLILELADQLKSINFKTTEVAAKVKEHLESKANNSKLGEFRHSVYKIIERVFNMKPNKKVRVNFEELERAIVLAFELHILGARGMQNVITMLPKFYAKYVQKPNEELLSNIEEFYKNHKADFNDDKEEGENYEEVKMEETGDNLSQQVVNKGPGTQHKEKEYCILCLGKTREIVFIPCCHFLACPDCAPRVLKCPICNTKVQKNLKLFWS